MIPDPCPRCGHTTHPTHAAMRGDWADYDAESIA